MLYDPTITEEIAHDNFCNYFSIIKMSTDIKRADMIQVYTKKELAEIMMNDSKFVIDDLNRNKILAHFMSKSISFYVNYFRSYGFNISYLVDNKFKIKSI